MSVSLLPFFFGFWALFVLLFGSDIRGFARSRYTSPNKIVKITPKSCEKIFFSIIRAAFFEAAFLFCYCEERSDAAISSMISH